MTGKLGDLNDHLFAQLDRLAKGDLTPEQIAQEVQRAEAIVAVSDQVTGLAKIQLSAAKLYAEHGQGVLNHLPQIGTSSPKARADEG